METKKLNPYTKRNIVQTRVDIEEFQEIREKADLYFGGDISRLVREALRVYKKPVRRPKASLPK